MTAGEVAKEVGRVAGHAVVDAGLLPIRGFLLHGTLKNMAKEKPAEAMEDALALMATVDPRAAFKTAEKVAAIVEVRTIAGSKMGIIRRLFRH